MYRSVGAQLTRDGATPEEVPILTRMIVEPFIVAGIMQNLRRAVSYHRSAVSFSIIVPTIMRTPPATLHSIRCAGLARVTRCW